MGSVAVLVGDRIIQDAVALGPEFLQSSFPFTGLEGRSGQFRLEGRVPQELLPMRSRTVDGRPHQPLGRLLLHGVDRRGRQLELGRVPQLPESPHARRHGARREEP